MASLPVIIGNYSPSRRGRMIGILDSFFSIGPAVFAAIYGVFFVNGHITDEQNQNLTGYYMLNGVTFGIFFFIGIFLVRPINSDDSAMNERRRLVQNDGTLPIDLSEDHEESHDQWGTPVQNLTGWKLFRQWDFQFLLWAFLLCSSVQLMFINNIPTYLKSFHNEHYNIMFTVISPLVSVGGKLLLGFLSDFTIHKVPRVTYQLILNSLQTVFLLLCTLYVNDIILFFFANVVVSLANSATFCLVPTLLSEQFGTKYFARNWGWFFIGLAIGGFILQAMFGYFYDMYLVGSEKTCYGIHCFQYSFIVGAVLSLCAVLFNAGSLEWRINVIWERWYRSK